MKFNELSDSAKKKVIEFYHETTDEIEMDDAIEYLVDQFNSTMPIEIDKDDIEGSISFAQGDYFGVHISEQNINRDWLKKSEPYTKLIETVEHKYEEGLFPTLGLSDIVGEIAEDMLVSGDIGILRNVREFEVFFNVYDLEAYIEDELDEVYEPMSDDEKVVDDVCKLLETYRFDIETKLMSDISGMLADTKNALEDTFLNDPDDQTIDEWQEANDFEFDENGRLI